MKLLINPQINKILDNNNNNNSVLVNFCSAKRERIITVQVLFEILDD